MWAVIAYNEWYRQSNPQMNFLWKLDNDILLDKDSLNKLLEKFLMDNALWVVGSIVFPLLSYTDMKINLNWIWEIGCKINFLTTNITKKTAYYNELENFNNNQYKNLSYSIWCSNLIKKEVLDNIWFLDPDFFLYYDDSYFSYKTKKAWYWLLTATNSIVYHKWSASTWGIMKPLGVYYTTLSENIFFFKCMPKIVFYFYFPLIFIKRLFLTIFRLIKSKKIKILVEWINMFLKANKNFITHNWN